MSVDSVAEDGSVPLPKFSLESIPTMPGDEEDDFKQRLAALWSYHRAAPGSTGDEQRGVALEMVRDLLTQTVFKGRELSLTRLKRFRQQLEGNEAVTSALPSLLNDCVDAQSGRGALHICAAFGYAEHARILLGLGSGVDMLDVRGWSPLLCAHVHGHAEVVELLVDRSRDDAGVLCVHEMSAHAKELSAVRTVSEALIRAVVTNDTATALQLIRDNRSEAPALQQPVAVIPADILGLSDRCGVCMPSSRPCKLDQASDGTDQTPLFYAAMLDRKEVVEALLAVPAVLPSRQVRAKRLTALAAALCRGNAGVVKLLLAQPLDRVRVSDRLHAYLYAIFSSRPAAMLELLLRYGAVRPFKDALAEAALFTACSTGAVDVVRQFVKAKVNFNTDAWNVQGETPLMRALFHGQVAVTECLLSQPTINLTGTLMQHSQRQSIVHQAVRGGSLRCLEMILLKYSSPVPLPDVVNNLGLSALDVAAQRNHAGAIALLLQLGNFTSRAMATGLQAPAAIARCHGHEALACRLETFVTPLAWICSMAIVGHMRQCGLPRQRVKYFPLPPVVRKQVLQFYDVSSQCRPDETRRAPLS